MCYFGKIYHNSVVKLAVGQLLLVVICYETNSQNRIKERSTTWKSISSRGKHTLNNINEQFLDDSNEKTSFLYIGVHGVTI